MLNLNIIAANIFLSSYNQADFFGKIIILALVSLSMICWIVLIQKVWVIYQVDKLSNRFYKALMNNKDFLLKNDLDQLPLAPNVLIPHPYASIYEHLKRKTLEVLNKNQYFLNQNNQHPCSVYLSSSDLELLDSYLSVIVSTQHKKLEKNLFILSTIVTLAPFMGLLGTVWGILITFSGLQSGGTITSNVSILGGISTALATTVLGLIIAIPALIAYNYLKSSIHQYCVNMDTFLTDLLSHIEIHYRKVE